MRHKIAKLIDWCCTILNWKVNFNENLKMGWSGRSFDSKRTVQMNQSENVDRPDRPFFETVIFQYLGPFSLIYDRLLLVVERTVKPAWTAHFDPRPATLRRGRPRTRTSRMRSGTGTRAFENVNVCEFYGRGRPGRGRSKTSIFGKFPGRPRTSTSCGGLIEPALFWRSLFL